MRTLQNPDYYAVHSWVRRNYGIADRCTNEGCLGLSAQYDWANITGVYRRNIENFKKMCRKCHLTMDNQKSYCSKGHFVKGPGLCLHDDCVDPALLEPDPKRGNVILREITTTEKCGKGHTYTHINKRGHKMCRTCKKAENCRRRERVKEARGE